MRKTSTKISKVKINGRRLWCVTWPKIGGGRNRKFFTPTAKRMEDDEAYSAAKTFLDAKRIEQMNYGTAATSFTERQRAEYLECAEKLKPHGKSLRDAVNFYLPHLQATARSCTAAELTAELLRVKAADGASARYLSDLRSRLGQFAATFNGKPVAEISVTEVDHWLRALSDTDGKPLAGTTRNNFRRVLIVALNYAIDRGYCIGNAAEKAAKAKETKLPAGILTVQQAADLLTHADAKILPGIALGLFSGIRPESEGLHLDWSHIDFEDKTINVEPDKTKVDSSARYVDMSDNLIAWLLPHRKAKGPIFPVLAEYYTLLQKARKAAGIEEWPHDALRHSYGSYHYGAHRNAAVTQAQMGHTNAKIFFKHYRKPLKQAIAARYWKLAPVKAGRGKVVAFATAA